MGDDAEVVNQALTTDHRTDDAAIAAIRNVLRRQDLDAIGKCRSMAALFKVEETPSSNEQRIKRLAWLVWQKTGGICFYCDEPLNPFQRTAWNGFQVDHARPRAQGGTDELENLVPACARCNWSKYARTPEQWGSER